MNILGIIMIIILPILAGYSIRFLFNNRETSRIGTYLIGFFFLFFLNGSAISAGIFMNVSLKGLCLIVEIIMGLVGLMFLITGIIGLKTGRGKVTAKPYSSQPWQKDEWLMLIAVLLVVGLIVLRVFLLYDYVREDAILPTVRTTLSTDTIYRYNPITSQISDMDMIASKKLIALPIYYACLVKIFGINEQILLYIVLTLQTIACTYLAGVVLMRPILRSRRKLMTFLLFLGCVILSGDYFSGAIGKKILWHGYAGDTIVAAVMLTYEMYIVTRWYRQERGDGTVSFEENIEDTRVAKAGWRNRIYNLLEIGLCGLASIFMTSVSSGLLLIIIVVAVASVCCTLRFGREEV